ncbi:MAG: hypothetical protein KAR87_04870 [Candidatus Aenigmarchaeota archaeon]|nr:hypothetical protein [Candidatus Aenigmarchaeota archaeon]
MGLEITMMFLLILLGVLLYAYFKRPWKRGYLYVKDNGNIMRGRSYATKRTSFRKGGEVHIGENKENVLSATNEEKPAPSKFDFLFGKKDDEK